MKTKILSILTVFIVLGNINPVVVGIAATSDDTVLFQGNLNHQIESIEYNFLHQEGALSEKKSSDVINSMENSLAASIMFDEYNQGGSPELLPLAQLIVGTSSKFFGEAFASDNRYIGRPRRRRRKTRYALDTVQTVGHADECLRNRQQSRA